MSNNIDKKALFSHISYTIPFCTKQVLESFDISENDTPLIKGILRSATEGYSTLDSQFNKFKDNPLLQTIVMCTYLASIGGDWTDSRPYDKDSFEKSDKFLNNLENTQEKKILEISQCGDYHNLYKNNLPQWHKRNKIEEEATENFKYIGAVISSASLAFIEKDFLKKISQKSFKWIQKLTTEDYKTIRSKTSATIDAIGSAYAWSTIRSGPN